jgi:uncharacterized membrane protein HdeD (DUF308 family)
MAKNKEDASAVAGVQELEDLKSEWWWFLLLGMGLIVLGMIGIATPFFMSLATASLFGVLLLVGGAAQIISSFWAGKWSGFLVSMLTGILYLVIGMLMLDEPLTSLLLLTKLLAAFLMVSGLFKIIASMYYKFTHWGWALLNGFITLFLGIMIWRQLPYSAVWVIGLFVGIEMIFNGWTWVMLGMSLKSLDEEA